MNLAFSCHDRRYGFTLVEMAIVIVIIGLVVGGVIVGQDLIESAKIQSQVSQIEQFKTANNTFRLKYDALPGDMDATKATRLGFTPRGNRRGEGDGNGIIEGTFQPTAANSSCGICQQAGETAVAWVDLTTANGLNVNLFEGAFSTALNTARPGSTVTGDSIALYLPKAKINNNYVYIYSTGSQPDGRQSNGINYLGISGIASIIPGASFLSTSAQMSPAQAVVLDTKMDDGLPQSGKVTAQIPRGGQVLLLNFGWGPIRERQEVPAALLALIMATMQQTQHTIHCLSTADAT